MTIAVEPLYVLRNPNGDVLARFSRDYESSDAVDRYWRESLTVMRSHSSDTVLGLMIVRDLVSNDKETPILTTMLMADLNREQVEALSARAIDDGESLSSDESSVPQEIREMVFVRKYGDSRRVVSDDYVALQFRNGDYTLTITCFRDYVLPRSDNNGHFAMEMIMDPDALVEFGAALQSVLHDNS